MVKTVETSRHLPVIQNKRIPLPCWFYTRFFKTNIWSVGQSHGDDAVMRADLRVASGLWRRMVRGVQTFSCRAQSDRAGLECTSWRELVRRGQDDNGRLTRRRAVRSVPANSHVAGVLL